jgi:hypothetical protein
MLDVHGITVTPGAVLTLGSVSTTIAPGGDGQSVAGVPIGDQAILVQWGFLSPTADTIAAIKLWSQDMVDPVNGVYYVPGAASLLLSWQDDIRLKYKTGLRGIQVGTNTGVVAGTGILVDDYENVGQCVMGDEFSANLVVPQSTTFGGALTANTWGSQALAPTNALPNGKYAILGWMTSACTQAAIRFQHADFKGLSPGGITCNYELTAVLDWQTNDKDVVAQPHGAQFIALGKKLGKPCCPVFTVSNAGTGLTIQMIAAQAATPVVTVVLQKVG